MPPWKLAPKLKIDSSMGFQKLSSRGLIVNQQIKKTVIKRQSADSKSVKSANTFWAPCLKLLSTHTSLKLSYRTIFRGVLDKITKKNEESREHTF